MWMEQAVTLGLNVDVHTLNTSFPIGYTCSRKMKMKNACLIAPECMSEHLIFKIFPGDHAPGPPRCDRASHPRHLAPPPKILFLHLCRLRLQLTIGAD